MKLINQQVLKSDKFNTLMKLLKRRNIKKIISYQDFSELVKSVVEEIMEITLQRLNYLEDSYSCQIKLMSPSRRGTFNVFKNCVTLNERVVYNLYCGNILELLTIFHELNHFKIKYELIIGKTSYDIVRVLKEKLLKMLAYDKTVILKAQDKDINIILNNSFKTYYKDNYELISEEKLVNIRAIKDFIYIADNFRIKLSKPQLLFIRTKLEHEMKNYQNYIRDVRYNYNFNYNFIDFETAFDIMVLSHPEWLKFSQLQIEYYLDEVGNVKKRTPKELFQLFNEQFNFENKIYIKQLLKGNIVKKLDKSVFLRS